MKKQTVTGSCMDTNYHGVFLLTELRTVNLHLLSLAKLRRVASTFRENIMVPNGHKTKNNSKCQDSKHANDLQ